MKKLLAVLMALCMLFQTVGMVALAEELPVEAAPVAEAVAEEIPAEAPVAEAVVEEVPVEAPVEAVVEEIPVEAPVEAVAEEIPAEAPVEAVVEEIPVEAPVEEAPVEEVPAEEIVEEAPAALKKGLALITKKADVTKKAESHKAVYVLSKDALVLAEELEGNTERVKVQFVLNGEKITGYVEAGAVAFIDGEPDGKYAALAVGSLYEMAGYAVEVVEEPVVEEIVEEPVVEEIAEEPAVEEVVEEIVEEPVVEEIVEEPVIEEIIEEPVVEEIVEEPVIEVVEEIVEEPVIEVVEEIVEEPVIEVVEEIIEEPVVEVVEEIIEEPVVEVVEEIVEEPVIEVVEEIVEEIVEEPTEEEKAAPDYSKYFRISGGTKHYITEVDTRIYTEQTDLIIPATGVDVDGNTVNIEGILATAFARNTQITGIVINSNVAYYYIAPGAFQGCTNLKSVSMPNATLTNRIENETFKGCTSLSAFSWNQDITSVGISAFEGCTGLTSMSFPLSVTSIEDYAFKGCTGLKKLNLQEGLTTIGANAFSGCTALEEIGIPNSVTTLGSSAFEGCTKAVSISFPANAAFTEIMPFTFQGCTGLTSVTIPDSVAIIGRMAFKGCSNLALVNINDASKLGTVGEEAFLNIKDGAWIFVYPKTVKYGKDALGKGNVIFGWKGSTTQSYCTGATGCTFVPLDLYDYVRNAYFRLRLAYPSQATAGADALALIKGETTVADLMVKLSTGINYATREDYVRRLYQAMLNRDADDPGLKGWVDVLNMGASQKYVINGIASSQEFAVLCANMYAKTGYPMKLTENRDQNLQATAFVARCYTILMEREFDVAGLNNWTGGLLAKNQTGISVVLNFVNSAEFQNKYATVYSTGTVVEKIYRTMLDRMPDATGKAHWQAKLDMGMSVERVVYGFSGSWEWYGIVCPRYGIVSGSMQLTQARDMNEGVTGFVYRCYVKALDRKPADVLRDGDGLNNWCAALLTKKATPAQVARSFVFSAESLYRNLDNSAFVTMMYNLYMGREPEAAGFNNWMNYLATGGTREGVATEFANSAEFRIIVASYGLK